MKSSRALRFAAVGPAVLFSSLSLLCVFEVNAFGQTAAPTSTAASVSAPPATAETSAPAAASPADSTPTSAPPDQSNQVVAHPAVDAPAGDKAAIPQTDERVYIRSPQMKKAMMRRTTWDLNLELGYGRIFPSPPHWEGFFRGGAGLLFVRDPIYWVLRFTYDYSPRSNATIGTELEANWVETGLWGNIGLMKDANSVYWGGRASIGWAVFGFEAEYRGDSTTKTYAALYGKLRLPLGVISQVLQ